MSKLSANVLFHFTPREYLLDKFERGFIPRYNTEFDPILDGEYFYKNAQITHINKGETTIEKIPPKSTLIPMVCFCDIPLSSLDFHMDVYSSYGIGLRKEWGEEKGLNPVMYVNEGSSFFSSISGLTTSADFMYLAYRQKVEQELKEIAAKGIDTQSIRDMLLSSRHYSTLLRDMVITHLKPRIAKGKYRGKYENYSYYDEKEWRFVPHLSGGDTPQILSGELNNLQLKNLNEKIKDRGISFTPDMVKYIIVKNDEDIEFLVMGLNDIKRRTRRYTEEDIHSLTSKIITRKQIKEDF